MLPLLVSAMIWQGHPFTQKPYLPAPTGKNGYEEYVRAAEFIHDEDAGRLMNWISGQKPPVSDPDDPEDKGPTPAVIAEYARLNKMTPLEIKREAVKKYGRALDLIAQGNAKPVSDPRTKLDAETLFPEYAGFKNVSRFAAQVELVYAADGRTDLSVKTLLDQLTFADNFGRGILIANLVGIANFAITVRAFQDLLPRMSRQDAILVARTVDGILARPLAVRASMAAEAAFTGQTLRQIVTAKIDPKTMVLSGGDDEEKPDLNELRLQKEFLALSQSGKEALMKTVENRLNEQGRAVDRILQGPEKSWLPALVDRQMELEAEKPVTLADYFVSTFSSESNNTQFVEAYLRSRTQLRLVGLYANAIRYRWDYGVWPAKIDSIDPMNGEPYLYEIRDDGTIRIASKGTKTSGEIDLKYKRPEQPGEVRP